MPIYSKNKKNVLFIHIPKSGGSSLSLSLRMRRWKESLTIRGRSLNDLNFMKCSPQHYHSEILNEILNLKDFDQKITIVRNPYERIKSEFYWQLRTGIIDKKINPKDWFRKILNKYESNNYLYDNHIRFQSEFIIKELKVFKLEENGVEEALNFILGKNKSLINKFFTILKIPKSKENVRLLNIEEQFTELKSEIIDFYLKDYEMFNYDLNL